MRIYRHNGEQWCIDDRSGWRRVSNWLLWRPNASWSFFSVLGHTVTYFGHWAQLRVGDDGWLVVNWREEYAYVSRNGTPVNAHIWLWGAPSDVSTAAEKNEMARIADKVDRKERTYS